MTKPICTATASRLAVFEVRSSSSRSCGSTAAVENQVVIDSTMAPARIPSWRHRSGSASGTVWTAMSLQPCHAWEASDWIVATVS